MRSTNAEFDSSTGAPIVAGEICIEPEADSLLQAVKHNRLLLRFNLAGFSSPTLGIWPVTSMELDENGFCKAVTACPILFLPINENDINFLWRKRERKGSLLHAGYNCGQLASSPDPSLGNQYGTVTHHCSSYRLEAIAEKEGLALRWTITVVTEVVSEVPDNLKTPSITVQMQIPWETLTFMGFIAVPGLAAHVSAGNKLFEPYRNPFKLQDLLISKGLSWPVIPGCINITPTDHRPGWRWWKEANHIVLTNISEYNISFHDASRVEMLESGFVQTRGSQNYTFVTKTIGQQFLNKVLNDKDAFQLSLSGDCIGHIAYDTPYKMEPSDPLGHIRQSLASLEIEGNLTPQGLEISASGKISDFEPAVIEKHRHERNSQLKPCTDFNFQITLPWALLLVRKFTFAYKASRFAINVP